MKLQNFQVLDNEVILKFLQFRKKHQRIDTRLNLAWSNWGFGMEPFEKSVARLAKHKVHYIELHGNRYGPDLGYKTKETKKILDDHGIRVSGICGMVSPESEFSSNMPHVVQRAIDYFRRQVEMCAEFGGSYVLFGPAAVGRPRKYDDSEFYRAVEAMQLIGEDFLKNDVRAGIEPIRVDETSHTHTFAEAKKLIDAVGHPGIRYIAGDLYHMLHGEHHIPTVIVEYGDMLTNLHMADTNRRALGTGFLDLDMVLMSLYVAGYNNDRCFCSAEPLGPGGDPYDQLYGMPDPDMLDRLVGQTARYFYEREEVILTADPEDLERKGA
jgi:D-psicose/D-tagatose/L-ribulose 3-epimerase